MSYRLFGSPGAASLCVHWMLIELGVPFEYVTIDFTTKAQKDPAFLKINPAGHVPALEIDGTVYAETAALLMLLAERHPQASLAPSAGATDRGAYLQWMIYLANFLMPSFRLWFYPEEGAGSDNIEGTKAQARIRIEKAFARIDGLLADGRSHMLGNRLTTVDFLATMLMRWSRGMPKPATEWPHIAAYVTRMRAMASYHATHEREGLDGWI